jgi:hypothetical protein
MAEPAPHVGTLRETPLHASLKQWCARDGDRLEVPVDGFVIDLVRDDSLVEIQTRGFSSMKRKLTALLDLGHRVRIVHPIAARKWIVKLGADGEEIDRRRSPKHGDYVDVFGELVSFPALVTHPSLTIEVLLTHEEEYRVHDPARAWRRRGWVVQERRLIGVVDAMEIRGPEDLASMLPGELPEPFTTADLAESLSRTRRIAQQMAYCLRHADVIEEVGRRGNTIEYRPAVSGRA